MKQSNKTFLSVFVALVGGAIALPLIACSSDDSARAPYSTASTSETTQPGAPPAAPTTGGTQGAPSTPTGGGDSGGSTPAPAPAPDCSKLAPGDACTVAPQCGCSPTQTCDIVNSKGTTSCITAGTSEMGKPCTATAGCARGLTCIFGTCHAFCDDTAKACSQPGTGACVQVTTEKGDDVPDLRVCHVACELSDPNSCGGKTNAGVGACFSDGQGGTDCQQGGTRAEGQSCSQTDKCGPGLVCASTSSSSACKRWCRVGQNDCGAGKTCSGFATDVKVGNVVYGACP